MRILIAEDNRFSRLALLSLLQKWDYDVVTAEDGDEALAILSGPNAPHLAILDWQMPGLTGVEVCKKVRALKGRDYVYLALLTAREQQDYVVEGFDSGVDDYIIKPFNPRELRGRLRAAERILGLHAELDAIYHTSPVAMMVVDRMFCIRNMNQAASALVDQVSEALRATCPLRGLVVDALATGRGRTGEEIVFIHQSPDGDQQAWFQGSSQPVNVSDEELVLLCMENITDRKKAEMALAELNKTLEARVTRRTDEVHELLRQKNEFVARLSHDLKTPLVPLVGLLPLVHRQTADPKLARMLELAIKNVGYMKDLAEKTLRLARLNTLDRTVSIEEVDLLAEINDVLASQSSALQEAQCAVVNKVTGSIRVLMDSFELKEVFLNLISNALKYGAVGGVITVDAYRDGDDAVVSFADTGIGMTALQACKAFDEFYKADESRHDHGSAGLGLNICKNILERYNGRIWAESPGLGKGTTICLSLPLSQS